MDRGPGAGVREGGAARTPHALPPQHIAPQQKVGHSGQQGEGAASLDPQSPAGLGRCFCCPTLGPANAAPGHQLWGDNWGQ